MTAACRLTHGVRNLPIIDATQTQQQLLFGGERFEFGGEQLRVVVVEAARRQLVAVFVAGLERHARVFAHLLVGVRIFIGQHLLLENKSI